MILSRKGFDASAGGVASPLLEDGRLWSLPIPDPASPVRYRDLRSDGGRLGELVPALTRGKIAADAGAHLDPDLDRRSLRSRPRSWRPSLGQCGAARSHLERHGVGPGDLFLFFGWFRQAERTGSRLRFSRGAPDQHVVFGWLQVGEIVALERGSRPPAWARRHPHASGRRPANNALYAAAPRLRLPGLRRVLPGAGRLRLAHPDQRLTSGTAPGRSTWSLPGWLHPEGRASVLSYHEDPARWRRAGARVELQSARRGQEFVLDARDYPEAPRWAARLITAGSHTV